MFALLFFLHGVSKKNYVLILFALWTFAQLSWLHLQMFDYLCGESYWHSNYRNLFLNGLQMYFRVKHTYPDPSLVNFMIYYSLNRGLDGYNGYGVYLSYYTDRVNCLYSEVSNKSCTTVGGRDKFTRKTE